MADLNIIVKYSFPLCFIWLCPVTGHAMADPSDTFQPFVSDTITYYNNLFLQNGSAQHVTTTSSGQQLIKNDMMNTASGGGNLNYTLGRQIFKLNLSVSDNRYVNNTYLNNISSSDRAAWLWQLGRELSGEVGYDYTRAMGGFTNTINPVLNIITNSNVFATVNYAWHPRWKARGNVSFQKYTNGASQWSANNQEYVTGLVGLDYATESKNTLGIEYSYTNGKYPNRQLEATQLVDNKYQQHNVSAVATWKPTEKTGFDTTVGYLTRLYPDFGQRNYNGVTYNLLFNWSPTAKTALDITAWRVLGTWSDVTSSYVLTEGFSVAPTWKATTKLALTAKFSRQTLDYTGDQIEAGIPTRQDTVLNGQVSVTYSPVTNAQITLGYQGGKRNTVNGRNPTTLMPYDYDYNFSSVFSTVMLKF